MPLFSNRIEAGQLLAEQLKHYANRPDVLVLALPRGGVPIGFEITKKIHAPLDIFLVRKLGAPGYEELAMGAIAMGGITVINEDVIQNLHITQEAIEKVIQKEQAELERRNQLYRNNRPMPSIKNKIIILVDDGLATGATMRAAIKAVKTFLPKQIIVAVPVAALSTYLDLKKEVDDVVCLKTPEQLYSIGAWYAEFPQLEDEEVLRLLKIPTQ